MITRSEIYGLVASFIVRRLALTQATIDELILEGERIALKRGWHPVPAS